MQKKSFLFTLTLILVLFGSRGYSELYPREVFQVIQTLLAAQQVEVAYEELEENEDKVLASNLTLSLEGDYANVAIVLPTLQVVKRGSNLIEIIIPDTFAITSSTDNDLPIEIGQVTLPETRRIMIEQDLDGYSIDTSIPKLEVKMQDESLGMLASFQDILGKVQMEDINNLDNEVFSSSLSIGEFSSRFQYRDGTSFAFKGTDYTSNIIDQSVKTINKLGMDLPLGDYNFAMETAQFILDLDGNSTIGILINQPSNKMNVTEDGVELAMNTKDFLIAYEGIINDAMVISDTDFNLTLDWSDLSANIYIENDITLNRVRWESPFMERMDPLGEFTEEAASLQISNKINGNQAVFDIENLEEVKQEDLKFTLFSEWEIRILDLYSIGSGVYHNDRGKPSIDIEVDVEGAEDFSGRLVAAGLINPNLAATILFYLSELDPTSNSGNSLQYSIKMDDELGLTVNGIKDESLLP